MKRKIELICWVLILVTCLYLGGAVRQYNRRQAVIEAMNRQELHYDADDYFVMIDTGNGLIGLYRAITPLKHYNCTVQQEVTTPRVRTVAEIENLGLNIAADDLADIYRTVPDWTPVLIY